MDRATVARRSMFAICVALFGCDRESACSSQLGDIGGIEVSPPLLDWGDVVAGQTVSGSVTVRNTGTGPVRVDRLVTTCGCAAALADQRLLLPGQTTEMHLTWAISGKPGRQEKRVLVHLSGSALSQVTLPMTAYITVPVQAEPSALHLGAITPGTTARVELRHTDGLPLELEDVLTPDVALTASFLPDDDDPSVGELEVRAALDVAPGWRTAGDLVLSFAGARPHQLRIPVRARRELGVVIDPSDRLVFLNLHPHDPAIKTVSVAVPDGDPPLRSLRAEVSLRGTGQATRPVAIEEVEPGRRFVATVDLGSSHRVGVLSGTLSFQWESDHPGSKDLLIFATVRSETRP